MDNPGVAEFDQFIGSKLYGFKDKNEYYMKASSIHVIEDIKIPCIFMYSWDDAVVQKTVFQLDVFKYNPNIALVTTKYGGHTAYFTSFIGFRQWFMDPIIKFFKAYTG